MTPIARPLFFLSSTHYKLSVTVLYIRFDFLEPSRPESVSKGVGSFGHRFREGIQLVCGAARIGLGPGRIGATDRGYGKSAEYYA